MEITAIEALYPEHVAHQRRVYAEAMRDVGCDAVLVHSGTALKKTSYDDQYWPVRPTPFFHHWVPLYEGGCFLLIDASTNVTPRLFWSESKDFWEVIDRGTNFDYVDPQRKEKLRLFFSWFPSLGTASS